MAAESVRGGAIGIRRATAMLRIVLPLVARTTSIRIDLVSIIDVRVPVVVAIEVVVDIDVDIVASPACVPAPSAAAPEGPHGKPGTPRDGHTCGVIAGR